MRYKILILFIILLVPLAYAATISEVHGQTLSSAGTNAQILGMYFICDVEDRIIDNATRHAGSGITNAYIYSGYDSAVIIANSTFTNNVATFTDITCTKDQPYILAGNDDGASYDLYLAGAATSPVDGTFIIWQEGMAQEPVGSGNTTRLGYHFLSMDTSSVILIDNSSPTNTFGNLTSEGGDGQLLFDYNSSGYGTITHKLGEPANLPDREANFDGIDMSDNVLLYHFDGNSTSDHSGNGNDGTVNGGANVTPLGKINDGYMFDGSGDYVQSSMTDITGFPFAISVWVNTNFVKSQVAVSIIDVSTSNIYFTIGTDSSNTAVFEMGARDGLNNRVRDFGSFATNEWNYLTVNFINETHREAYQNANLETIDINNITFIAGIDTVLTGVLRSVSATAYWNGTIDEVAIFNRSLSVQEIKRIYEQGVGYRPSRTNDTTPTYSFKTDEASTCALYSSNRINVSDNNTVLLMTFDQNATDESQYGNDGVCTNMVAGGNLCNTTDGKIRGAIQFDGVDDYVELPITGNMDITSNDSFTLSAWIKPGKPSRGDGLNPNAGIISIRKASTQGIAIEISLLAVRFMMRNTTNLGFTSYKTISFLEWHHVVGTYDSATQNMSFYVDGEFFDDATGVNTLSPLVFRIGERAISGNTALYNGTIDEGIVDKTTVWSSEKVSDIYNNGLSPDLNYSQMVYLNASRECSTTGSTTHICTVPTSDELNRVGLASGFLGCKDSVGNENRTSSSGMFYINLTDPVPPKVELSFPKDNAVFQIDVNNTIRFNASSTDNVDKNYNCTGYVDGVQQFSNATYINNTEINFTKIESTLGTHTWNYTCIDSFNNQNSSARSFEVKGLDINFTINEPPNNTLIYSETDIQLNFTINFTEQINSCYVFINGSINRTNESIVTSNVKIILNGTNLTINKDYEWSIGCNTTIGLSINSTDKFNLFIFDTPTIDFSNPTLANNSITNNNSILINVSFTGRVEAFTLEFNGVNETIIRFNSTLGMLINKTGLIDLTTYTMKVYLNDTNGLINMTEERIFTTNFLGITVSITTGVNFIFKPFIENNTLRVQNISCEGQTAAVGCVNFSVFGNSKINMSLLFNITLDPPNQRIIEDFSTRAFNWSIAQKRSNNTQNISIVNASVTCGEIQSINSSGLIEYRYDNKLGTVYNNASNISILINVSVDCTKNNYYTLILNGTRKNMTGFDFFNFTFKGDNTTNTFTIKVGDDSGTIITSPTITLSGITLNNSGMSIITLDELSFINISVTNVTGTDGLSGFFVDNLRIMNLTSNQSTRIRMKSSCTGNYENSTLLIPNAPTLACFLQNNTPTNYVWLYQDINLTQKGIAWKLLYTAVTVS